MDISRYISDLLYEHDCVIIPGFGGLVCNYRPAEIHPILHTIHPPTKSITFNRNLTNNDGLLVNYIARKEHTTYDEALQIIQHWATSAKSALQGSSFVQLDKIGTFQSDIENNVQFAQHTHNFLKSSYALPVLTAAPVLRGKEVTHTDKFTTEVRPVKEKKLVNWRIAAFILILLTGIATAQLMWLGIQVKPLNLNEAGIYNTLSQLFKVPQPEVTLIPVETETYETDTAIFEQEPEQVITETETFTETEETKPVIEDTEKAESVLDTDYAVKAVPGNYYIMVGAFSEEKNVMQMKERLQQRFPDSVILIEKGRTLTKMGFAAGNNYSDAVRLLEEARKEDSTCWLLKK